MPTFLPFTAKADLRDNYPFGMFAVPREQVARIQASSGTTGKATVVGYTADDLDTCAARAGERFDRADNVLAQAIGHMPSGSFAPTSQVPQGAPWCHTYESMEATMSEQNPEPVVVAIGLDPMDAALEYAADEAARAGCGLHLVHVVHHLAQGPEMALVDGVDIEHVARQTLRAAEERARDLVSSDLPVTTELLSGALVPSLVAAGARTRARMIVLQRRQLSRVVRIVTRSVSSGVAAHAEVPVVSVPAGWAQTGSGDERTVTVGVDVADRSEGVFRVALDAARGRGARLRVLHAWSLPTAYTDIIMPRTQAAEWETRATREIRDVLNQMGDEAADLNMGIEVCNAHPSDALIEAGRTSQLLVIGRHDSLVPFGSHLGPVARAVLQEATCPVLLADPRPRRHWGTQRHHATTT